MTNAEISSYMEARFEFLNARSQEIKDHCVNQDQIDDVDDAVNEALNQSARAQNQDFQKHEAAVEAAVVEAGTAQASLEKSLQNLQNITRVLEAITKFIDTGAQILLVAGL